MSWRLVGLDFDERIGYGCLGKVCKSRPYFLHIFLHLNCIMIILGEAAGARSLHISWIYKVACIPYYKSQ